MENSPEITEKFYEVFQEMSSKRKFTGIGEKVGKHHLEKKNAQVSFGHLLSLKQSSEGAPQGPFLHNRPTPDIKQDFLVSMGQGFCQGLAI